MYSSATVGVVCFLCLYFSSFLIYCSFWVQFSHYFRRQLRYFIYVLLLIWATIWSVHVWPSSIIWFGTVRYLGPGFTVLYPEVPRWYHGTRYGTYSARPKNRSCKHPIPKEFWNNEHAESRLALLYVNCYRQAESRLLIIWHRAIMLAIHTSIIALLDHELC